MLSQAPIQIAPRVLPLNDLILHYQLKRDSMYILVSSVYCYLTLLNRIDVRDQLKHLEKDPREEDQLEVEMLQQALTTDLSAFDLYNRPSTRPNCWKHMMLRI